MKRVALMFAGQGAQAVGMGADLYKENDAARAVFEQADALLQTPISNICFEGPQETLTESRTCQPAIYATSVACLAALRDRISVEVCAAGGLSLGEFGALTAVGALNFEQGIALVAKRGELMQQACRETEGGMAAVLNAPMDTLESVCAEHGVDIANVNCPGQTVISGAKDALQATVEALQGADIKRIIPLDVDGAFHSRLMKPTGDQFGEMLARVEFREPSVPVMQNVVGGEVCDPAKIRNNLQQQISGSVLWESCVRTMLAKEPDMLIELGPGKVLSGFMRRIDRSAIVCNVSNIDELDRVAEQLSD